MLPTITLKASVVVPCFNERDCSTDATREILEQRGRERCDFKLVPRKRNGGKGDAVQAGLKAVLLRPIQAGKAEVVCNMRFDTTLTDMETCYKVFTGDLASKLKLRGPRWGFDPEITARNGWATASTRSRSRTRGASSTRTRRSPGVTASSCC